MATYDLEEQEQIAELKAWWKQYGNLLLGILTLVSLGVVAWQGWNWYQRSQSQQAAAIYGVLQNALRDRDPQRTKTATGEIIEKFGGTAYAPLAALSSAKALVDAGDTKTAKLQLLWVAEHGKDELRDLARLRLAALLLDEKAYGEALKQLEGKATPGYAARFLASRGEILLAEGKRGEARNAYREALTKLDETDKSGNSKSSLHDRQASSGYRDWLQAKLDALGESD
ncbi:MAG: tetratricopeptide repeat protein [Elusimicrobia bacterium]|nr:MAG: tetratricopeptide repeat protein [Elusimicrobiota bacterium]